MIASAGSPPVSSLKDELLHTIPGDAGHEWTETSYFGFSIPDAGINVVIYHWLHPVLRVLSGGVLIWRGRPSWAGRADHMDYRNYLPFPRGDLDDVEYATGVSVKVVRPFERIETRYRSEDGSTTFDVAFDAVAPPVYRGGGGHFAQVMRTTGTLAMNGEQFAVGGFFVRNRSFGGPRSEGHQFAPLTWNTPVFGSDLAYHFVGADPVDGADGLQWGFVWDGTTSRRITAMRPEVTLSSDGGLDRVVVELDDDTGASHRLHGTAVASLPMPYWPNMVAHLSLMRWTNASGRIGFGDSQLMISR